ncbi:MAG: ABC transporter permease, partial [Clostridiales bacterium]|nr:ABC transporter permease [Clostridiales bacterium]
MMGKKTNTHGTGYRTSFRSAFKSVFGTGFRSGSKSGFRSPLRPDLRPAFKSGFSLKRFFAIIKKEFIQIKRDPISLRMPIIMPIVMMLIFGYAVKTEVDHIPTAVYDNDMSTESREYIRKFASSDYFSIEYYVNDENALRKLVDSGTVRAALIIPSGYAKALKSNNAPSTQLIIDGTDPTTARTALNSGILISEMYSLNLRTKLLQRIGSFSNLSTQTSVSQSSGTQNSYSPNLSSLSNSGVSLNTKVWYNPNLDSNRFTIPSLVGLILQNITIMLTAFALVREKERSTIEQLIVTPVRPGELILGKLVPYIIIGYTGFLFALSICLFWFRVEPSGSIPLLLVLGFLFVLCSLSIGMLISTFAANQLQAMMFMIFQLLPSILLCGFIFPREAMPLVLNLVGYAIPLTYFLKIIRSIILKGVGPEYFWTDICALFGFTSIILFIATKRFRKSL